MFIGVDEILTEREFGAEVLLMEYYSYYYSSYYYYYYKLFKL